MEDYRIEGSILRWIAGLLEDRKHGVQLNGHKLGWKEVRSGLLQGSVLGLHLFTIFIIGINEKVLYEISKFADDKNS